jgi:hypothetical protein
MITHYTSADSLRSSFLLFRVTRRDHSSLTQHRRLMGFSLPQTINFPGLSAFGTSHGSGSGLSNILGGGTTNTESPSSVQEKSSQPMIGESAAASGTTSVEGSSSSTSGSCFGYPQSDITAGLARL